MAESKQPILDRMLNFVNPEKYTQVLKNRVRHASLSESGYLVPGSNRNSMKGINVSPNSPDLDTAPKLQGSRALSRDLTYNAPLAVAAIKRARTNIVGSGLIPQPTINHKALGITVEQADAWEDKVEQLFQLWGDSKLCDYSRRLDFWSMQRLVVYSFLQNGDLFSLPVYAKPTKSGMWPFELRVKLIEADLCRTPLDFQEDFRISNKVDVVSGIEHGKNGQMVAAWFADHYDDFFNYGQVAQGKFKRVEAFDKNGRANFQHIFDPDRIEQRRGMPFLAPVVNILKQITRLGEAELQATIVSSLFTVFIKDGDASNSFPDEAISPQDAMFAGGSVPGEDGNQVQLAKQAGHEWDNEMGAGTITNLQDNKEIEIADPRKISEGFEPFYNAMVTEMSAALEIPKEQLLLHFSSSYTAARGALLEGYKFYKSSREFIARSFCQPIYEEFLTEIIAKGWIQAPGFFDDPLKRQLWSGCQWIGPGNGSLNPLVEYNAAVVAINNNLSNHSREFNKVEGGKWDKMISRRKREQTTIEELGLDPAEDNGSGLDEQGDGATAGSKK